MQIFEVISTLYLQNSAFVKPFTRHVLHKIEIVYKLIIHKQNYRVAHEKPARRLVDQRGRRSRTLYRKLNKCKCKVLTG